MYLFKDVHKKIFKIFLLQSDNELPVSVMQTSETISDSAECYAGLSVRFESSATCM